MEEGKDAEEEARRRLEEEMEEFQREEDDKVKKMWKQEEAKVEELQKREEERVRIMLASARTEAALNAGRALPAGEDHGRTSEEEMVRKMVEPAKAKTEAAMKNSQDTWRQEEVRVKALKRREEERMKILVASAKTQAAKNIEKASAESEERVRRKIAENASLLSQ